MYEIFTETRKRRCLMRISMIYSLILIGGFHLLFASNSRGQSLEEIIVTIKPADKNLEHLLKDIELQTHLTFAYLPSDVRKYNNIGLHPGKQSVKTALEKALVGTELGYRYVENSIIIFPREDVEMRKAPVLTPEERSNDISVSFSSHASKNEVVQALSLTTPLKIFERRLVRNISGRVVDSEGEPLIGVNIQVKDSNKGTATDFDGNFVLEDIDENAVLVISYIGYQTQEIVVGGKSDIEIVMVSDSQLLDEVVVVGYSVQRKQDVTGAVEVVNVEKMMQEPGGQVSNLLQGRASGVTILGGGQPGESPQVRIRGINTFGNNTPLYVIDGVPAGNIDNLNPNDISSIQVLKDASASIYGSRAANGVVLITTKNGDGKTTVSYDAYYGIQTVKKGNVWNLLSPMEMAELKWLVHKNSNPGTPHNDPLYGTGETPVLPDYIMPRGASEGDPSVDPSLYYVNPTYTELSDLQKFYRINKANKEGTDWFHEIFSSAPTMNHNLSISGSGDNSKFLLSMNYLNQEGTLMRTYLKRYSIRANSQFDIHEKVRIGENIAISLTDNPRVGTLSEGSPIGMARRQQTIIPVYDIMGNFAGGAGGILGVSSNPVADLERTKNNKSLSRNIYGNIFGEIDIIKNLMFRTNFGGIIISSNSYGFTFPQYENSENLTTNRYSENANFSYNWTWTNIFQYRNIFLEKHNLTVIAGTEGYENGGNSLSGSTTDYFSFDKNFTNLNTGSGTLTNSSSKYKDALFSYLGRVDYGFDNRYLFGFTLRRDGSSRFLNEKFGWFPAGSFAWRLSEETFFKDKLPEWVSDVKFRFGYGVMGNQLNVDPNNAYTTFGGSRSQTYYDISGTSNSLQQGFKKIRIGNPDASWEKNINSNFGLDLDLLSGKLNLTIDYYQKDIKDLLYDPELPGTAGQASRPFINIASMKNKGIDLSASSFFQVARDLELDINLTFTSYNNEITSISNASDYFDIDSRRYSGSSIVRNAVGYSIGQFFGYKIEGFWNDQDEIDKANALAIEKTGDPNSIYQNDVAVGRFRYADTNNDGKITSDDRVFLGNPNPDFSFGLNFGVRFKDFDFGMFLYGVYGNDIWNNVLWWTDFNSSFEAAKSKTALYDSWTPENHNAKAPIQEIASSFSSGNVPNSYFVEDGSYLRAKNMQLGYTIPINQSKVLNNLRIYIQGANIFTITKYTGLDPEVAGGTVNFGIDEGTYPNQRQFLFGLNLSF